MEKIETTKRWNYNPPPEIESLTEAVLQIGLLYLGLFSSKFELDLAIE